MAIPATDTRSAAPPAARRPLARLLRYAQPHRARLAAAALCSVLNKLFDLAPPLLIGAAVDVVVAREGALLGRMGIQDPREQLVVLAVLSVVIWGLESVFEFAYAVLWRGLAQAVQDDLRRATYDRVQSLELAYYEDRSTGGLLTILGEDVNQLERFLDGGANDVIQVLTTVLAIAAVYFGLAPSVAWLPFLPMPFILWASLRFQARLEPRYAEVRRRAGILGGLLANNLGGIATIKSFTAEAHEARRVATESARYRDANRAAIRLSAAFVPLIRMVIVVGFTLMLLFGGYEVLAGSLAVGAYSVMVFYSQRLLWPLTRLGQTLDLYQRAMASTARILDLLDTEPTISDGPRALPVDAVRGALRFEGVRFRYREGGDVLRGIDLAIPAGHTVAFVGPTGAGKSTIVKLLLRFYDVTEGRVTLDGIDVRALKLSDLRRAIGLVSQDVFLFDGTVRENIAYGALDAPEAAIVAAAGVAEAHAFIAGLAHGYDTLVGERGQKLSGGQRQRLSIARAVLRDPPVLVLDEATAAVDNETEAAIQRSLARIAIGRTTIVIAHRLSTVRHADRIYVLDEGRVVEEGHHESLLALGGLYASLWRVQTGERDPDPLLC